jgi:hypothetical protein
VIEARIMAPRPIGFGAKFSEGKLGAVAQLGERLVRNQEVAGSIPASSTTIPDFL